MTTSQCKAANRATCRVHGAQLTAYTPEAAVANATVTLTKINSGEFSVTHPSVRSTATQQATALLYFGLHDKADSLLASVNSQDKGEIIASAMQRSHAVLEFDKAYTKSHGYGHDKDKAAAVQKEFGFNEVRYYQILNNNPEVKDAQRQVQESMDAEPAEGPNDFIAKRERRQSVQRIAQEKLYGTSADKKIPNHVPTAEETKKMFDRFERSWEAAQFGDTGYDVSRELRANAQAERSYYEQH